MFIKPERLLAKLILIDTQLIYYLNLQWTYLTTTVLDIPFYFTNIHTKDFFGHNLIEIEKKRKSARAAATFGSLFAHRRYTLFNRTWTFIDRWCWRWFWFIIVEIYGFKEFTLSFQRFFNLNFLTIFLKSFLNKKEINNKKNKAWTNKLT